MTQIRMLTAAVAAAAFGVAAIAALAHEDHSHATGVVKERMETMTTMAQRLKTITQRMRANKDLAAIPADAHVIHELAAKIAAQFPPGSTQHPTAAKPAIWQTWQDFESKAKALEAVSEKLMSVNIRDKQAVANEVRAVTQACGNCHELYRVTK